MKPESRAALCIVVLALLIAGLIIVEKYWDCRLKQHLSERECFRAEVMFQLSMRSYDR
jgi:hypothetical protein